MRDRQGRCRHCRHRPWVLPDGYRWTRSIRSHPGPAAGAVGEVGSLERGMMLLIALTSTVAFASSWASTLGLVPHESDFWWELVVTMLLGHGIEMRSLPQTSSALDSLAALLPDVVERVRDVQTQTVAPADLVVGDVVVVRPGGRIPADGQVVEGSAALAESTITGES